MSLAERHAIFKTINKPKNVKQHNQKLILSMLRQTDTFSIAEISARAKLSKTTIAKILGDFFDRNLVIAAGKGASTDVGGKKPDRFVFNAGYSHVIALAVSPDKITGALSDLKCNLLRQRAVDCGPEVDYHRAVRSMADMVEGLLADAGLAPGSLCRIVLACEGIIDVEHDAIHYTMHHAWGRGLPIARDLAALLPFPAEIRVNNNVRLAGYAHLILNPDQYGTIAVISCSRRSAGGCIIEAQQLVRGGNGFVGEFGHMVLDPYSDVKCSCGGYGCFGALVSPDLVLDLARRQHAAYPQSSLHDRARDNALAIGDVFAASNSGDPFARVLMDRVVHFFAILIHNIVVLRDPAKVILQGVYTGAGDYFLTSLRKKVDSFPFYKMERELPISYSPITAFDPYLAGAVYFGVDEFLRSQELYS